MKPEVWELADTFTPLHSVLMLSLELAPRKAEHPTIQTWPGFQSPFCPCPSAPLPCLYAFSMTFTYVECLYFICSTGKCILCKQRLNLLHQPSTLSNTSELCMYALELNSHCLGCTRQIQVPNPSLAFYAVCGWADCLNCMILNLNKKI